MYRHVDLQYHRTLKNQWQVGRGTGFIIAIYWRGSQGPLQNLCKKAICEGQDVPSSKSNLSSFYFFFFVTLRYVQTKGYNSSPVRYTLSFLINIQLAMALDSPNEEVSRPLLWNKRRPRSWLKDRSRLFSISAYWPISTNGSTHKVIVQT